MQVEVSREQEWEVSGGSASKNSGSYHSFARSVMLVPSSCGAAAASTSLPPLGGG